MRIGAVRAPAKVLSQSRPCPEPVQWLSVLRQQHLPASEWGVAGTRALPDLQALAKERATAVQPKAKLSAGHSYRF